MSTTQNAVQSIETLTDKMKNWLSRTSPVPQGYLDRYERQQADHPDSEARRALAEINPETYEQLLMSRCTLIGSYTSNALPRNNSLITAAEAHEILSVLNSIPLSTQYFCSDVKLRVNTAMKHVKNYHNDRVSIDNWQRGNVFKRTLWWYKFRKGESLPAEAALWESGHVSRVAVKGSYKMPRLARRFLKEAWKMKMLCGECAFWMKMMGVVEASGDKVFYDVENKVCHTMDEPVAAESGLEAVGSDRDDESESYETKTETDGQEEKEDGEEEVVKVKGENDEVEKNEAKEEEEVRLANDYNFQPTSEQLPELKSVPEFSKNEATEEEEKETDVTVVENEMIEEEVDSSEDLGLRPVTSQHSQLETVPEVDEQDLEALMNVEASQLTDLSGVIITSPQSDTSLDSENNNNNNETESQVRQLRGFDPDDSEPDLPYSPDLEPIEERREEEDAEEESYLNAKAKAAAKQTITNGPSPSRTAQPAPKTRNSAQPTDPEDPLPAYHEAYFHPKATDAEVALFHAERLKSNVNREQFWNPPPRYLDAESQRYCMDDDSKWRVRIPRMSQRQVIERRKGEERRRQREAKEKYERETPFWRQWRDSLRRLKGEEVMETIRKEEGWVDEKSEAYAHVLQRTMMFGRGEPPAGGEAENASGGSNLPPADKEDKEAQSSVGVLQSGIHVKRQVFIHRCRLHQPFRQRTKTTIKTTGTQPDAKPTTIFSRAKRSLVIRPGRARNQRIPPTPRTFTPTPDNLKHFHKAVKRLLNQRKKVFNAYVRVARFVDGWEKSVGSGQAWLGGKERMEPEINTGGSRGH